jgi:hypothetical protein
MTQELLQAVSVLGLPQDISSELCGRWISQLDDSNQLVCTVPAVQFACSIVVFWI